MEEKKKTKEKQPLVIPKTTIDFQRMKLARLMKDPDKPVIIPDPPRHRKVHEPPEFVRNVMGSSAGAGSGEFHVYRHLRRKEYSRQKFIDERARKEKLDENYRDKLEENKLQAEIRTAKKRAKRLKKKMAKRQKKKKPAEKHEKEGSSSEESDDDGVESSASDENTCATELAIKDHKEETDMNDICAEKTSEETVFPADKKKENNAICVERDACDVIQKSENTAVQERSNSSEYACSVENTKIERNVSGESQNNEIAFVSVQIKDKDEGSDRSEDACSVANVIIERNARAHRDSQNSEIASASIQIKDEDKGSDRSEDACSGANVIIERNACLDNQNSEIA